MADNIQRNVELVLQLTDQVSGNLKPLVKALTRIETLVNNVSTGITNAVQQINSMAATIQKVDLGKTGVAQFADSLKQLQGVDTSNISPAVTAIKKLHGVTVDPSLATIGPALKSIAEIGKFPSFTKLVNGLKGIKEIGAVPDLTAAAEGIKAFKDVKIPSNLKDLGPALKDLKGLGRITDISKFVDNIIKLKEVDKLPNASIGTFIKHLKTLSGVDKFPSLVSLTNQLIRLKDVTSLPDIRKFASGLKDFIKATKDAKNLSKLRELAALLKEFAGIGNVPSMTAFVNSMQKLKGLDLPSFKQITKEVVKLADAFAKLTAASPLIGALQKVAKGVDIVEQNMKGAGNEAKKTLTIFNEMGRRLRQYVGYRIIADSIILLKEAFISGRDAIIDYDQALKNIQAITSATDDEIQQIGVTIERVASTTKFSATEVADAMRILGQAGLSAAESMNTIQAVADLATGTLTDMTTTVDLITTALRVFDIQSTQSGHIADVFANAVNRSKLTVDKLRTSMNYVGPIAAKTGLTIEETAAAMGTLANSGLRASTIGTGLRRVLAELADPSKKLTDAARKAGITIEEIDPQVNSLSEVLSKLNPVLRDTQVAFEIFGKRGAAAALTLAQQAGGGFDQMLSDVQRFGTAQEQARKQMEGLGVSLKNLNDKLKLIAVALGKAGIASGMKLFIDLARDMASAAVFLIDNGLVPLIDTLKVLFVWMDYFPEKSKRWIITIGVLTPLIVGLARAIRFLMGLKVVQWVTKLGKVFFSLARVGGVAAGAMGAFRVALAALSGPLGWIITGITLLVTGMAVFGDKSSAQVSKFEKLRSELLKLQSSVSGYIEELDRLDARGPLTDEESLRLMDQMADAFPDLAAEIFATAGNLDELKNIMIKYKEELKTKEIEASIDGLEGYGKKLQDTEKDLISLQAQEQVGLKGANEIAKERRAIEKEADALIKNMALIVNAAEEADKEIDWSLIFDLEKATSTEPFIAVLTEVDKLKEKIEQKNIKEALSIYGFAGDWAYELEEGTNVFREWLNDNTEFGADVQDLLVNVNRETIENVDKQIGRLVERVKFAQDNLKGEEFNQEVRRIAEASAEINSTINDKDAEDQSVYLLKKASSLQKWYDEQKKQRLLDVTDAQKIQQIEFEIWLELQHKKEFALAGDVTPAEILKSVRNSNKIREIEHKKYIDIIDRQVAEGEESHNNAEKRKAVASSNRYQAEYESAKKASDAIKSLPGSTPEDKQKAQEQFKEAQLEFEKAKTDIVEVESKQRIELTKQEYTKSRELRETALAKLASDIAEQETSGVINTQQAILKKETATLEYYNRQRQAAAEQAEIIRNLSGEDNKEYEEALKEKLNEEEKYFEKRLEVLERYNKAREKSEEDIEKAEKNRAREQLKFNNTVLKITKKRTQGVSKLENDLAKDIEELEDDLQEKLTELQRERTEDHKDYVKERLEAEQEAAANILLAQEDIDDKIRAVQQRGKSERSKDISDERAAVDKLRRGLELVRQARSSGDKEALEAGTELIDQAGDLYAKLKDNKDAIKGLEQIKKAQEELGNVGADLVKSDIAEEKAKSDEKYAYERGKAQANFADELKDRNQKAKEDKAGIKEAFEEASKNEKLRHDQVMEDLGLEQEKLIETLELANQVLSKTTSDVKLNFKTPSAEEVKGELDKTTKDVKWEVHYDPKTGVATQIQKEIAKEPVEIKPVVKDVDTTQLETAATALDSIVNKAVTVAVSVSGLDQLQLAIDLISQIQDKVVTITVQHVSTGVGAGAPAVASAFNGGLIGMFNSGGEVFKKLAHPFITAGRGFLDDVPALLARGEYVQRARAVREYGVGFMRAVNNLQFPKELASAFASGGLAGVDGIPEAIAGLRGSFAVPDSAGGTRSSVDNSRVSTYNVRIGDKGFKPRGKVVGLTNRLVKEVKRKY